MMNRYYDKIVLNTKSEDELDISFCAHSDNIHAYTDINFTLYYRDSFVYTNKITLYHGVNLEPKKIKYLVLHHVKEDLKKHELKIKLTKVFLNLFAC